MSARSTRPLICLAAALFATACSDMPTVASTAVPSGSEVSLDQAMADANSRGDTESADAFAAASLALRLGARPTEIAVTVDGQTDRYQAVVTATAVALAPGDTALQRSLVAWSGVHAPVALLQVNTLGDVGSFSSPSEPVSDPRTRANGIWSDLVRGTRWIATVGSAAIAVQSKGTSCTPTDRSLAIECTNALFEISIDGLFRLGGASPDAGAAAVRIQTSARDVNGVIVSRAGGGRTPGPVIGQPGRPVPTGSQRPTRG